MSSFLSRVKAQFASSTSTPSSSSKKSSNIHLSAPSSSSTPSGRTPSSTSSAKSPPARQGTISRKISQLSASSSSAPPNGSNGKDYPPRGKTPLPTLELSLDEPLSPGGIGLTRRGSVLDLAVNEGDEETGADDEKKREILGKSRWTSEQVREFVELVGQKMKERDMSTPGLFLPHVLPSSPPTQTTLPLAYLRVHQPSLFPPTPPPSSLTLTPPTPAYLFASELRYTAHVHDLASSLRFSLRHLAPSKDRSEWYDSFSMWEKEQNFESNVWAQMGGMNEEVKGLMGAVGEVVLGAGALVDRTGVGVAKLARLIGYWVLRDGMECGGEEGGGEVMELVRVWERLGRRMEHLMLAYIRYQSELGSIPTRLLPLIEGYPFRAEGAPQFYPSTNLLGPPPFTTRPRSVLHVKIRSSTLPKTPRNRPDPVYLAEQAFRATVGRDARPGHAASLWESIRERVKSNDEGVAFEFGEVFDGETIRVIKLAEETNPSKPKRAPTPAPVEEPMYRPFGSTLTSRAESETQIGGGSRMSFNRKRSMSQSDIKLLSSVAEGTPGSLSPSSPFSEFGMKSSPYLGLPASSAATERGRGGAGYSSGTSWAEFSSSGFGETTPASPTSPAASLQVGNGFSLPSTSNPRKLTARSPDMERILANKNNRNSTWMDSPGGSPTTPTFRGTTDSSSTTPIATAPATPTPKAEIDTTEILSIDETFFEWTQDVLLDPELANACNFPVWAVYELGSAITTPSTSASPSASSEPTWLLISLAHSKPAPPPPAQPAKPAPVEMAALRPAAANEFGRRSPNESATTAADKEEKKNRRKSLLSFGSLSGLGRRMSGGASSALEFKEKGKRSASTSSAAANPPKHEKAASSVPSTAAGQMTPKLTVATPAPILARQESAVTKSEDEVVDIGRTPSAEPEVTPVVDAPHAEPVVPIADDTTSSQPVDPSPPAITSSPPRPSTPPFLPLGPILPSPPSPSPARFSLDRTRTRASISPSLSRSVSYAHSQARPQSPENEQIEQAVDQLVEHLRVGSPVPVERSGSLLGGGMAAAALVDEPKEKAEESAKVVSTPEVAAPEPVPIPEEVVPPSDSEADAPQTLEHVAEVLADKVEATVSSAIDSVVGLLQEVGMVAAPAPAVDEVAPKPAEESEIAAAAAVDPMEAAAKDDAAPPLSTTDATAMLDGALAELKQQETSPA